MKCCESKSDDCVFVRMSTGKAESRKAMIASTASANHNICFVNQGGQASDFYVPTCSWQGDTFSIMCKVVFRRWNVHTKAKRLYSSLPAIAMAIHDTCEWHDIVWSCCGCDRAYQRVKIFYHSSWSSITVDAHCRIGLQHHA